MASFPGRILWVAGVLCASVAMGCGGKGSSGGDLGSATSTKPPGANEPRDYGQKATERTGGHPPASTSTPGGRQRHRVVSSDGPPTKITTPNGSIYIPPTVPSAPQTTSGRGCVARHEGPPAPPKPGLQVREASGRTFVFGYEFRLLPSDCRPVTLDITLDDTSDSLPGNGDTFHVRRPRGRVRVVVSQRLSSADIASATAISADGVPSSAARIRVR
jgi:hypothetical protein